MVKTRRSLIDDGVPEEEHSDRKSVEDSAEDKKEKVWPRRSLRSSPYRVQRNIKHWPNKLSRRLRTIKMPRIVFPGSDTEPEKYSRRDRRPVRVYFADEPAPQRTNSNRAMRKNYMEDSGDKPIQQNVRRSGRQRKLLHLNFNESWITNELQVKGYPGLYGQYGQICEFSSESSSDERRRTSKRMPTVSEPNQSSRHEEPHENQEHGDCGRRTSARFRSEKKITMEASDSEMDRPIAHAKKEKESLQNGDISMTDKDATEDEKSNETKSDKCEEHNDTTAQDSESNHAGGYRLRRIRQRVEQMKKDQEDGQESGSDSSSESDGIIRQPRRSKRTRKPTILQLSESPRQARKRFDLRNNRFNRRRRTPPKMSRRTISDSESSSDSSSTSHDLKVKNSKKSRQKSRTTEQVFTEKALREIQPVQMDGSITFGSVGGLEEHKRCMREIVLFPLMYPSLYQKYNLTGSRGIMLHGPPGSGKTLLARALATECSRLAGRKVSFFMRKGADCLRKWVGESERLIKLLFQQARAMKPSIIFFDEIDALAPIRTGRQDQVHTSVVGTLLAEMDGLCDRGEVVVIGATNRVDAVDPALRRPGRFDRELYFPAPNSNARLHILEIHTSKWSHKPEREVLEKIADLTHGYAGADLKALCSEAIMQALRRVYPQVYMSDDALLIDVNKVEVSEKDWMNARVCACPGGARALPNGARPLSTAVAPLLKQQLHSAAVLLQDIYSHIRSPDYPCTTGGVLLVKGDGADSILAPALVHQLDHATVKELNPITMHTDEQVILSTLSECRRAESGSLLWVRHCDRWQTHDAALLATLWRSGVAGNTCLMLLSAQSETLNEELESLLQNFAESVYEIREPTTSEVVSFLKPLAELACTPPHIESNEPPPELPKAPPPPPPRPSPTELARRKRVDDYKLRELRIFLRDVCRKLAANRRFYKFTKPVDLEEITDYLDIVKQPMDLETIMTNVDLHKYSCAKEFLEDIDLICANALEYNPDRTSADKQIRHEACSLRDHAHALIEVEMDSDFETQCREIARRRQQEGDIDNDLPDFIYTAQHNLLNGEKAEHADDPNAPSHMMNGMQRYRKKRRRGSNWAKGKDVKRQRTSSANKHTEKEETLSQIVTDDESRENKPASEGSEKTSPNNSLDPTISSHHEESIDAEDIAHKVESPCKDRLNTSGGSGNGKKKRHNSGHENTFNDSDQKVILNKTEFENVLTKHVKALRTLRVEALVSLYTAISRAIHSRNKLLDRSDLPKCVAAIIEGAVHKNKKSM